MVRCLAHSEDAYKAAEHAAERDRLAEQQKQLEEETRTVKNVEAAAEAFARRKRADVRRKALSTVKSLKAAVLEGRVHPGALTSGLTGLQLALRK